jgi:hypothetical protein
LKLKLALGDDSVNKTGAIDFEEEAKGKHFSLSFSQILTKNFIASISYESVFINTFKIIISDTSDRFRQQLGWRIAALMITLKIMQTLETVKPLP